MIEVRQTVIFREWLDGLADKPAAARIAQRIVRLQAGLLGDVKSVGGGVMEMRVDTGPGYRVYFVLRPRSEITASYGAGILFARKAQKGAHTQGM